MKTAVLALFAVLATAAFAQEAPNRGGQSTQPTIRRQPVQIRVRHADPWAIKALLEGQSITAPEISTILALMGMPQQAQQSAQNAGKALFDDGTFIVNPGDNSLWFIPNR